MAKETTEEKLIETFEEACKVLGYDPATVIPDMSSYPEHLRKPLIAGAKLFIINEALNLKDGKPWVPDWNDEDEDKYYPWFDMEKSESNPSGFGLLVSLCDGTGSGVGSRLVYRTRKLSDYAGKQFEPLYRDLMVIQ